MVKSPIARILLCLAVLALIGVTALALGTKQNFTTIDNGRKAIATKGPSVVTPRLREIDFGEWEGLTWREVEARDAAYSRAWCEAYPKLPAPGGESFADFQSRVIAEAKHLLTLTGQGSLAVVTHSGVMRVVLRLLSGLDEREAWERTKSYCCFFKYTHEASR